MQDRYDNVRTRPFLFCLKKKLDWQQQPERRVKLNRPDAAIGDNGITTTKYTLADFIPLNLYEQFSRLANLYFLVGDVDIGYRSVDDGQVNIEYRRQASGFASTQHHPLCEYLQECVRRSQEKNI